MQTKKQQDYNASTKKNRNLANIHNFIQSIQTEERVQLESAEEMTSADITKNLALLSVLRKERRQIDENAIRAEREKQSTSLDLTKALARVNAVRKERTLVKPEPDSKRVSLDLSRTLARVHQIMDGLEQTPQKQERTRTQSAIKVVSVEPTSTLLPQQRDNNNGSVGRYQTPSTGELKRKEPSIRPDIKNAPVDPTSTAHQPLPKQPSRVPAIIPLHLLAKSTSDVVQQAKRDTLAVEPDWRTQNQKPNWIRASVVGFFKTIQPALGPVKLVAEVVGTIALQTLVTEHLKALGFDPSYIGLIGQLSSSLVITSLKVLPTLKNEGVQAAGQAAGWSFVASVKTMVLINGSNYFVGESWGYLIGSVVDEASNFKALFVGRGTPSPRNEIERDRSVLTADNHKSETNHQEQLSFMNKHKGAMTKAGLITGLVLGLHYYQSPEKLLQYVPQLITWNRAKIIWKMLTVANYVQPVTKALIHSATAQAYNTFIASFVRTQTQKIIDSRFGETKLVPEVIRRQIQWEILNKTVFMLNWGHVTRLLEICVNVGGKYAISQYTNQAYQTATEWKSVGQAYESLSNSVKSGVASSQELLSKSQAIFDSMASALPPTQAVLDAMKSVLPGTYTPVDPSIQLAREQEAKLAQEWKQNELKDFQSMMDREVKFAQELKQNEKYNELKDFQRMMDESIANQQQKRQELADFENMLKASIHATQLDSTFDPYAFHEKPILSRTEQKQIEDEFLTNHPFLKDLKIKSILYGVGEYTLFKKMALAATAVNDLVSSATTIASTMYNIQKTADVLDIADDVFRDVSGMGDSKPIKQTKHNPTQHEVINEMKNIVPELSTGSNVLDQIKGAAGQIHDGLSFDAGRIAMSMLGVHPTLGRMDALGEVMIGEGLQRYVQSALAHLEPPKSFERPIFGTNWRET